MKRWPNLTDHTLPRGVVAAVVAAACGLAATAHAATPDSLAQTPLFLTASAPPNVLLMLDNSGSMQNIVPAAPFDPDQVYLSSCPASLQVPANSQVDIRVASGAPLIRVGGVNYVFGTVSSASNRCFDSNTQYMARLQGDNAGSPTGYLAAEYSGNYLNWYFDTATDPAGCTNAWSSGRKPCTESRMMIAQRAGKNLIDTMSAGLRAGLATYNNGVGGRLLEVLDSLDAGKRTAIKADIDALSGSGATPLAETLSDIGYYLSRGATNLTLHPDGSAQEVSRTDVFNNGYTRHSSWDQGANPIQYSCQRTFTVLLTDGRPQVDQSMSSYLSDYDGDCANADPACGAFDQKPDRGYESAGSDYLDDVAQALFEVDLRPDLTDLLGSKNNLSTYLISFADDQALDDELMPETAAQGGGRFFQAGNEAELADAFARAIASIMEQRSSAASTAANSQRADVGTFVYQARFNSEDWSGEFLRRTVDASTGATFLDESGSGGWPTSGNAADNLTAVGRVIITHNPAATGPGDDGLPFQWASLPGSLQALLNVDPATDNADGNGELRLNYLRGDQSLELRAGGTFRNRSLSLLGDIINSAPVFVGEPNAGYPDFLEPNGYETYSAFVTRVSGLNSGAGRPSVLWVGANDGMLHGFDAGSGRERLAYVPRSVFANLPELTWVDYQHRYYVDGSPSVGDVTFDGDQRWHTVLVGGLNAGGQGIYALDITNPAGFTEGGASSIVLWEVTPATTGFSELGYTFSRPAIVKNSDGEWVVMFGNGYASASGHAVLYVVDAEDGGLLDTVTLESSAGGNGLSTIAPVDVNGDQAIDVIYAGDLRGNLWKLIPDPSSTGNWVSAFGAAPLYAGGATQPITARPEVGLHPEGLPGLMVYFGTGKYFENGDNVAGLDVHRFYGIWDLWDEGGSSSLDNYGEPNRVPPASPSIDNDNLLQQCVTTGTFADTCVSNAATSTGETLGNFTVRFVSDRSITHWDWDETYDNRGGRMGWYLELPEAGEKSVTEAVLRFGRISFVTLVPTDQPCTLGGDSWLMELDAADGSRPAQPPVDLNGDQVFNQLDTKSVTGLDGAQTYISPGGTKSEEGVLQRATDMLGGEVDKIFSHSSGSTGEIDTRLKNSLLEEGRKSWIQLK